MAVPEFRIPDGDPSLLENEDGTGSNYFVTLDFDLDTERKSKKHLEGIFQAIPTLCPLVYRSMPV